MKLIGGHPLEQELAALERLDQYLAGDEEEGHADE